MENGRKSRREVNLSTDIRELVKRCLEGNQGAMVQLVDHYSGQVFGLCYRMLGQRQDAEDAAQETFVRVLKNLHRWDADRDFEPWLLAIAGNRCRTALARRIRRPNHQPLGEHASGEAGNFMAARLLGEEIHVALGQLRDKYREAFLLFHEHELSYAEIAEVMECPVGTVRTWIHRARRELIHHLKSRGVLEGTRSAVREI